MNGKIRIATVYSKKCLPVTNMAAIRWLKISEALADLGYQVDMIFNTGNGIVRKGPNLRLVPYALTNWEDYDVIKTLFNSGFENLRRSGGGDHPFIISKLGSVVGRDDSTEGVYFFGKIREELFQLQKEIAETSRYVTVLTAPSKNLWTEIFGDKNKLMLVPGAAERHIPEPRVNPYSCFSEPIVLYAGHIYDGSQPEINHLWKDRLNTIGRLLRQKGIRLCFLGTGNTEGLDSKNVSYLGAVEYDGIWDYHYFANGAIALAQGRTQHNESTKIYYYLRTGLPVVSESSIPNNYLIREACLGFIADYGDNHEITEMVEAAIGREWDREQAKRYILKNHTWGKRARIYDVVIKSELGLKSPTSGPAALQSRNRMHVQRPRGSGYSTGKDVFINGLNVETQQICNYRTITEKRTDEFLQKGVDKRHFFPHRAYYLPKCGMDALKLSRRMCDERDPSKMFLITLHAPSHFVQDLSRDLFFDDDLVWHQQQFGKEGHIAFAYVVRSGDRLYGLNYVSDIVQRISRRRKYKTAVEKRFRGWAEMIFNSIVNFALEMEVHTIYSPGADLIMAHTDPARHVQRELFDRVYDRALRKQFLAQKQNGWWVMDVAENKDRVVRARQEAEFVKDEKTICICHDIERGLGHLHVDPTFAAQAGKNAPRALARMLDIESTLNVKSTYNVVGTLFGAARDQIEAGGHCIAFHSFDHNIEDWQLRRCRRVDYRVKGYRAPQSRITPELNDTNLCLNNFDWLASSVPSLGLNAPAIQNRIVKIPIADDDFDLYSRKIEYSAWEDRLLKGIAQRKFTAFGLHDCYGDFWLPHYKELLTKIKDLGTLQTLNGVSEEIVCQSAL